LNWQSEPSLQGCFRPLLARPVGSPLSVPPDQVNFGVAASEVMPASGCSLKLRQEGSQGLFWHNVGELSDWEERPLPPLVPARLFTVPSPHAPQLPPTQVRVPS
jgi:hypothetical protein